MKLESKYFDMIRIKPTEREADPVEHEFPTCQWKGCNGRGQHKAPRGRGKEGQFYLFCAEHIRQFNASYNYFDGMSDTEIEDFRKDAAYGHRPTWQSGANAYVGGRRRPATADDINRVSQARNGGAQGFQAWRARQAQQPQRKLKPLEKKSLSALGLSEGVSKDEIKAQFKALVKRHHPDANGGDRGSEERLREIIQAYNYLKQVGLV